MSSLVLDLRRDAAENKVLEANSYAICECVAAVGQFQTLFQVRGRHGEIAAHNIRFGAGQ